MADDVVEWLARRGLTASAFVALLPVVTIGVSESLLFLGNPSSALWGHVATILYAVIVPVWFEEETEVLGALALVSVFRCVSLAMPVFFEVTLYWLPFVYVPFLPVIYILRRQSEFAAVPFRTERGLLLFPVAVAIGYVLAELEYEVLTPGTLVPSQSTTHIVLFLVIAVALVAFVEEYLFRGVLQGTMTDRFGNIPGVVLASLVFGLTRAPYGLGIELVLAFAIGMFLGTLYLRTESLTTTTLVHGSLNLFLFGILPLRGAVLF